MCVFMCDAQARTLVFPNLISRREKTTEKGTVQAKENGERGELIWCNSSWHLLRVFHVLAILKILLFLRGIVVMSISIAEGGIMSIMAWKTYPNLRLRALHSQSTRFRQGVPMSEAVQGWKTLTWARGLCGRPGLRQTVQSWDDFQFLKRSH